jgi:hypothetical protein
LNSRRIDDRVRRCTGSENDALHTPFLHRSYPVSMQSIDGTPCEVPVPRKVIFIEYYIPAMVFIQTVIFI